MRTKTLDELQRDVEEYREILEVTDDIAAAADLFEAAVRTHQKRLTLMASTVTTTCNKCNLSRVVMTWTVAEVGHFDCPECGTRLLTGKYITE